MSNDETTPIPDPASTTAAAATTPAAGPDPAAVPVPAARARRSPRFGTVFWGVVLLVFAATMAVTALPWFSVDPVTLLLGACIAAGVLLVVAGVAAVVARRG